jgi:hypothetical protein
MGRAERIHAPMIAFFTAGHQRADTNDRVIDVLGELVSKFGSHFIIALADMTVRCGEALQVGTVSMSHTIKLLIGSPNALPTLKSAARGRRTGSDEGTLKALERPTRYVKRVPRRLSLPRG